MTIVNTGALPLAARGSGSAASASSNGSSVSSVNASAEFAAAMAGTPMPGEAPNTAVAESSAPSAAPAHLTVDFMPRGGLESAPSGIVPAELPAPEPAPAQPVPLNAAAIPVPAVQLPTTVIEPAAEGASRSVPAGTDASATDRASADSSPAESAPAGSTPAFSGLAGAAAGAPLPTAQGVSAPVPSPEGQPADARDDKVGVTSRLESGSTSAVPRAPAGLTDVALAPATAPAPAPATATATAPAPAPALASGGAPATSSAAAPATSTTPSDPTTPAAATGVSAAALPAAPVLVPVAVTAAAPISPPPAPAAAPALVAQVSGPIFSLASAGSGNHVITIAVTPDNLGPVTVRAHVGSDGIRMELFAPTEGGRDALRAILSDLRRDLAGASSGTATSLDLSSKNEPSGDSDSGNRREQRTPAAASAPRTDLERRLDPHDNPFSRISRAADSTIDVLA